MTAPPPVTVTVDSQSVYSFEEQVAISPTPEQFEALFLRTGSIETSHDYTATFECQDFCKLTVTIPVQRLSDPETKTQIIEVYSQTIGNHSSHSYAPLVISGFLQSIIDQSKKFVTDDPGFILAKIPKFADIDIIMGGLMVSVNITVTEQYRQDKEKTKQTAAQEYNDVNGHLPDFKAWVRTSISDTPSFLLHGAI